MCEKKSLGNQGEELARKYLSGHGYLILANNYRVGHKELDIIARKQNQIISFEVKARRLRRTTKVLESIEPDDCLTIRQVNRLKIALLAYCYQNRLNSETAQGDLIIVLIDDQNKLAQIKHYPKIF